MKKTLSSQKGFTLVELAIVMIIIGLLIGGILKGQELIANAQITNAVTQIKGMDGAVATFRETYGSFPGDMGNAEARIAGCADDATCGDATGTVDNGRIDVGIGSAPSIDLTDEGLQFFNQMRVADLITGFTGDVGDAPSFGGSHPEASIGGGFTIGHTSATGGITFSPGLARAGHYLVLTGSATGTADAEGSGTLSASQAARIDRKLDDGAPNTGSVVGINGGAADGGTCASDDTASAAYEEALVDPLCNLAIRVQG